MPREKFWQKAHPGTEPDLTIRWAPEVLFVQGDILVTRDDDPADLDRMIRSLKRARRAFWKQSDFVTRRTGGVTDNEADDIDRE